MAVAKELLSNMLIHFCTFIQPIVMLLQLLHCLWY